MTRHLPIVGTLLFRVFPLGTCLSIHARQKLNDEAWYNLLLCHTCSSYLYIYNFAFKSSKSLMWINAIVRPSGVVGPFTIILTITTTNIIGKNRLYLGRYFTSISVSTPISFKLKIKTKLNDPLSQRSGSGEKNYL